MERIRKQINNFTIRSNKQGKIQVFSPSKEMVAEYDDLDDAVEFTKSNKEYRHKKKEKFVLNSNNIDYLCDKINEQYNLKSREIGSIEHYSSMTENMIVQIGNDKGGFIPLTSGTDKELLEFLRHLSNGNYMLQLSK